MEISAHRTPGCGPVFKYLVEKHQELDTISIRFCDKRFERRDENAIVQTVFSNLNLRSVTIHNMWNTGDIFSSLPSTLPNLEKLLLTSYPSLSDQGLIEILNRSRSNLRELDLSCSYITGVGVEEGVNSLPNLETLKLSGCCILTDGGLYGILRLSGNKLRVIDVSWTFITGFRFNKGVKILLTLEELYLDGCRQLTDSGLLQILSISGNRLKTVNAYRTRISTAVRTILPTQYPSVQFHFW